MPKGYLVAHIRVHDSDAFKRFTEMSIPVIETYGGRMLARNPAPDHREGDLRGISVLIEFESLEAARQFYKSEEYTTARAIRAKAAETDLMLVEGL